MKKAIVLAEQAFTIVSLLLYSKGLLYVIISGGFSEGDGLEQASDYRLIPIFFLVNYVLTIFLLITRWKKVIYVFGKDWFTWILVGLAVISSLWSFSPTLTLTHSNQCS
ncbi:hypothetical protein [Nodularia sp. UHCC 0506]|uniref:hypothetical protein n=1 Tax=Nodularia sp. UHCC 0506 TaxID=3110243 RepID=UPI002B2027A5|nr:hypothetical protein [Nodularia sp. UHCC 0506]MEA5512454.1 hypothetical protein [Nodularia sp. UHCC 0506]